MYLLLILCFVGYISSSGGFQITIETSVESLPIQIPNRDNPSSFFRIINGEIEEIFCPRNHVFDAEKMICIKDELTEEKLEGCHRLNLEEGNWPNPDNCRTYFACNSACCYEMNCASYLVYNSTGNKCNYPLQDGCCEYKEKNPAKIVQ